MKKFPNIPYKSQTQCRIANTIWKWYIFTNSDTTDHLTSDYWQIRRNSTTNDWFFPSTNIFLSKVLYWKFCIAGCTICVAIEKVTVTWQVVRIKSQTFAFWAAFADKAIQRKDIPTIDCHISPIVASKWFLWTVPVKCLYGYHMLISTKLTLKSQFKW